jgi:hypothetical protein
MTRSEAGRRGAELSRPLRAARKAARIAAWNENPKRCECCGAAFAYDKRRSRFCSKRCAVRINNAARHRILTCARCDSPLATANPYRHKYCSLSCQHEHAYERRVAAWKDGTIAAVWTTEQLPNWVRRYMLTKAGFACSQCGWARVNERTKRSPLHVDHVDGDARNNAETNLRVLCPNCHALTPTFGASNKGRGRASRRDTYLTKAKRALIA